MLALNTEIHGKTTNDLKAALEAVARQVSDGLTSGTESKADGRYSFAIGEPADCPDTLYELYGDGKCIGKPLCTITIHGRRNEHDAFLCHVGDNIHIAWKVGGKVISYQFVPSDSPAHELCVWDSLAEWWVSVQHLDWLTDELLEFARFYAVYPDPRLNKRCKKYLETKGRDNPVGRNNAVTAKSVFFGSNGGATRSFCSELEKKGPLGQIAAQLFRAQKASSRAKVYRGGIRHFDGRRESYSSLAYSRKGSVLRVLAELLQADSCGLKWGWGVDPKQPGVSHVLYIETPQGQASFHSKERFVGPDYDGEWDGQRKSQERILRFCDSVYHRAGEEQQGTKVAPANELSNRR